LDGISATDVQKLASLSLADTREALIRANITVENVDSFQDKSLLALGKLGDSGSCPGNCHRDLLAYRVIIKSGALLLSTLSLFAVASFCSFVVVESKYFYRFDGTWDQLLFQNRLSPTFR